MALVSWDANGQTIASTTTVTAAKDRDDTHSSELETLLLFPLPTRCIQHAELDLGRIDGDFPDEAISVYASNLITATRTAGSVPRPLTALTLLDNRPRAIVHLQGDRAVADVTDTAILWQTEQPFPSQGMFAPAGAPLALDVTPSDLTYGKFSVHFGQAVLRLTLTSRNCAEATTSPGVS